MSSLPPPSPGQNFVSISPIGSQTITLPDKAFVSPADPNARRTVPSLSFLITHPSPPSQLSFLPEDVSTPCPPEALRVLFDLGLRKSSDRYLREQQTHLKNREPYNLSPSVAESLSDGPIKPKDIDLVILSHDHHGDPSDYPNARFLVGPGALKVLKEGLGGLASHQHFEKDLLPEERTHEPPSPSLPSADFSSSAAWKPLGPFPHTLDLLGDSSLYLISAPGHLPGHLNLLCRLSSDRWIYLAGDSAHDGRLLTGKKGIGTWLDTAGNEMCIHLDRKSAEDTIARITQLQQQEGDNVEVILAHDEAWRERNLASFYPNTLS